MRSSIFNFDFAHRVLLYATLERGVLPIILALCLVVVLVSRSFLVWINQISYTDGPMMTGARAALNQETQAVVLGSSQIYFGIRPSLYEHRLMNITGPNFDYHCLEVVLPHNIDRIPKAKVALIEFEAHTFCNNALEKWMSRNDYRLFWAWGASTNDLLWANSQIDTFDRWEIPIRKNFVAVGSPWRLTPRFWSEWSKARRRFSGDWQIEAGHMLATGGFYPPPNRPRKPGSYNDDWPRRIAENRWSFEQIVKMFRDRGIEIVLLQMPKHPAYRDYMHNELADIERHHPALLEEIRIGVGVPRGRVWNLAEDGGADEWTEEDFIDNIHANVLGSAKIAKHLNRRLNALFEELAHSPAKR